MARQQAFTVYFVHACVLPDTSVAELSCLELHDWFLQFNHYVEVPVPVEADVGTKLLNLSIS